MMDKFPVYDSNDETVEDLGLKGLQLIQKKTGFRFGTDAVLLSWFTRLKDRESVLDLCTGSGILPVLFAGKSRSSRITGVELQEPYAEMAARSVALNDLEERVRIFPGDVRDLGFLRSLGHFDVVTANPPYKRQGTGLLNPADDKMIARHEITLDLEGLIRGASLVLGHKGRFCLVHRPERLLDIFDLMRKHDLEPKRIRMVAPVGGKAPNMVLVEGLKFQKPYLKWEPQLEIYQADGSRSREVEEIYNEHRDR